eukprot:873480-Pelagomonas_calceolata.AAC.8
MVAALHSDCVWHPQKLAENSGYWWVAEIENVIRNSALTFAQDRLSLATTSHDAHRPTWKMMWKGGRRSTTEEMARVPWRTATKVAPTT